MTKNYTVDEVHDLVATRILVNFAATDEGQAHLNRIAKAITNESIDKRVISSQQTHAKTAFAKALAKVATTTPEKVTDFVTGKDAWIANYITRKYGQEE